jgi:ribosome-associated protein
VSGGLEIPDAELTWSFVRAAGPGGQNVNKVASCAQLRFDLAGTTLLDEAARQRLRVLAGRRVTDAGELLIVAREGRTQEANRRAALARLEDLLQRARHVPKKRRATRPTRASKERRIESKKRRQGSKRLRGAVRDDY